MREPIVFSNLVDWKINKYYNALRNERAIIEFEIINGQVSLKYEDSEFISNYSFEEFNEALKEYEKDIKQLIHLKKERE